MQFLPLKAADLDAIKALVDANDLFPAALLDDMTAPYLADTDGPDLWLTGHLQGAQAVAYLVQERLAEGVWTLLLIAVDPQVQGRGHGTALLQHVEALLAPLGQRLLIVETSGLPQYAAARGFYLRNGYSQTGLIPDFYEPGDDKVTFVKRLA